MLIRNKKIYETNKQTSPTLLAMKLRQTNFEKILKLFTQSKTHYLKTSSMMLPNKT